MNNKIIRWDEITLEDGTIVTDEWILENIHAILVELEKRTKPSILERLENLELKHINATGTNPHNITNDILQIDLMEELYKIYQGVGGVKPVEDFTKIIFTSIIPSTDHDLTHDTYENVHMTSVKHLVDFIIMHNEKETSHGLKLVGSRLNLDQGIGIGDLVYKLDPEISEICSLNCVNSTPTESQFILYYLFKDKAFKPYINHELPITKLNDHTGYYFNSALQNIAPYSHLIDAWTATNELTIEQSSEISLLNNLNFMRIGSDVSTIETSNCCYLNPIFITEETNKRYICIKAQVKSDTVNVASIGLQFRNKTTVVEAHARFLIDTGAVFSTSNIAHAVSRKLTEDIIEISILFENFAYTDTDFSLRYIIPKIHVNTTGVYGYALYQDINVFVLNNKSHPLLSLINDTATIGTSVAATTFKEKIYDKRFSPHFVTSIKYNFLNDEGSNKTILCLNRYTNNVISGYLKILIESNDIVFRRSTNGSTDTRTEIYSNISNYNDSIGVSMLVNSTGYHFSINGSSVIHVLTVPETDRVDKDCYYAFEYNGNDAGLLESLEIYDGNTDEIVLRDLSTF